MKLESGSHGAAVARATSYFSPTSAFNDRTGGVAYYHFLEEVSKKWSEEPEYRKELCARLKKVAGKLFTGDNLLLGYTADEKGYEYLPGLLAKFKEALPEGEGKIYPFNPPMGNRNEGFRTASQVNYVARCGTFRDQGFAYTGALKVLKVILNYEYLWTNLRVKGGAYGCMSGFGRSGEGYLVSYRDPNLKATNETYQGIPEYLEQFSIDDRDMTRYVIGAISDLDAPLNPSAKGSRSLSAFLSGVTEEMLRQERREILEASQKDIQALAPLIQAVLDTGALCVIGNDRKITEDEALFKTTLNLYH